MRFGAYFIPPHDDVLTVAAARWLGRDIYTGAVTPPPAVAGILPERLWELTEAPRRYGFHATLKAPFHLRHGLSPDDFVTRVAGLAAALSPVQVPGLEVGQLRRYRDFLVLQPRVVGPEADLAARVFMDLDECRQHALARRRPRVVTGMTFRQAALQARWGYPFVLDEFRFHMTLAGPVAGQESDLLLQTLHRIFDDNAASPMVIDRLAVVVEAEPGAPFQIHSQHVLCGGRHVAAVAE